MRLRLSASLVLAAGLAACGDGGGMGSTPGPEPRAYFMGFTAIPPRPDNALAIRTVDLWATRADAGLLLYDPPWERLLAGDDAVALVRANELGLANYFRGKGLAVLVASIDATDGLDRAQDSPALRALGRSLTEPAVRDAYVRYVGAFAEVIRPDYLSVASETNLVRAIAPPSLYAALVDAAVRAAGEAQRRAPSTRVFSTVQVEVAWGRLVPGGPFVGIARDRSDFAFTEVIGLSSYPYLAGFVEPEELPLDYYARLVEAPPLPVMVIEGGWTSASLGGIVSSPDKQRRYLERQARILDAARAAGWFQITFTDLDLGAIPLPSGSIVPLFAAIGLVDTGFAPKPALAVWDEVFRRPRRP
jgi:hypothetical protein